MIYEYHCPKCNINFELVRPVSEYNLPTSCQCGVLSSKVFSSFQTVVDKTNPEYYHSLGQVVHSKYERSELMKRKNLIEVGNEKPDTIHKHFEIQREENRKRGWEKAYESARIE